jgi:hypothetical protein
MQSTYLEICQNPLLFTYILVPGFKFVYRGCVWRSSTITTLFDNLGSMSYQHIRSHRTRDLSHTLFMSCLHTWECSSLDLLKLVSSVPMFTEAVDDLPTGLCRPCSRLGNSSMLLKRASQKSLCEIFIPPHEERSM